MANRFQSLTRGSIRRSVGQNLGIVKLGAATSTVDSSSLLDTKNLIGADDEFNGQEVLIYDATGSIVDGESSIVADFASATSDATCAPVFSASITTGDKFEMWKRPWRMSDINEAINQAINEATGRVYPIKETHTAFTESDKYLYDELSGFTHLTRVDYVQSVGTQKVIHRCDDVWEEQVDGDVTASADTAFYKQGGASNKFVLAAGLGAGDIIASDDITSLDISGCTELVIWIYSTVALSAGDLQVLLDNTALCASPVETLSIPATTANTWTRHIISLANPQSDSAIISVGLKHTVDIGAGTVWIDDIIAQDNLTNDYIELPDQYWLIAKGSTPYLQLTPTGLSLTGTNTQLRLTGHQLATRLDADASVADIDPQYIVDRATGLLLVTHADRIDLDPKAKLQKATFFMDKAARDLVGMTTSLGNTRGIS